MKGLSHFSITFLLLGMALAALLGGSEPVKLAEAQQAPAMGPAPRIVTVLVGGGQDTIILDNFFPRNLRVRVGDTVRWKFNGDANHHLHTATFSGGPFAGPKNAVVGGGPGEVIPGPWVPVPGGQPGELMRNPAEAWPTRQSGAPVETYDGTMYINSGHMRMHPLVPGMPASKEFSLTFTKPGVYRYACAFHPHMQGTVEVGSADAKEVPSQAEIDRQAKAETDHLLALVEKARDLGKTIRSEPGPHGTTFWFVRAGAFDLSADMRGGLYEFLPKNLTVKTGDTVIWQSVEPHTITFNPTPPEPVLFIVRPRPDGQNFLVQNPRVFQTSKPASVYDPSQYFNSAALGMITARGTNWALTFDKPGVYEYICAFHHPMGMKGTITVVSR